MAGKIKIIEHGFTTGVTTIETLMDFLTPAGLPFYLRSAHQCNQRWIIALYPNPTPSGGTGSAQDGIVRIDNEQKANLYDVIPRHFYCNDLMLFIAWDGATGYTLAELVNLLEIDPSAIGTNVVYGWFTDEERTPFTQGASGGGAG